MQNFNLSKDYVIGSDKYFVKHTFRNIDMVNLKSKLKLQVLICMLNL